MGLAMMRDMLRLLLLPWLFAAATTAAAGDADPATCEDAFGLNGGYENPPITPQPATVIPVHATSNDVLTVCTFGFIYADRIAISISGNRISAVVLDNGFSFSPNPPIVNREAFGPLPPGNYLMDVSVDADFTPEPVNYPYVLATNVPFSVSGADPVPTPAPAIGDFAKLLIVSFLAFAGCLSLRSKPRGQSSATSHASS